MTEIRPSDGCKGDTVPLAVERRYDFPEFGGYLGNVGQYDTDGASRYDRPMLKDSLKALMVLSALAGCAEEVNKPNLAVACALADCTCVSNSVASFLERNFDDKSDTTTAVLWTDRGNAYCPEGFSLHLISEKEKEKKENQYYTPP